MTTGIRTILLASLLGAAPVFAQLTEFEVLAPSDGQPAGHYGMATAIDGLRGLVGARGVDGERGAVYVVGRTTNTTWQELDRLVASDGVPGDLFGAAVDLVGDLAVVGAPGHGGGAGKVYVFRFVGGTWVELQGLASANASAGARFGGAVATDGEVLAAGAEFDDGFGTNAGAAFVFEPSGGAWVETAELVPSGAGPWRFFGNDLDVSEGRVLVAAWRGVDGGIDSGTAHVFADAGGGWSEEDVLVPLDPQPAMSFGFSVALDGIQALIGAPDGDDFAGVGTGAVYFFQRSFVGTDWLQVHKRVRSGGEVGDTFGFSVDLDAPRAVVGSALADAGRGGATAFEQVGNPWLELGGLEPSESSPGGQFGWAASVSGGAYLVGAHRHPIATERGTAFVFEEDGPLGTVHCTSLPNSSGQVASIEGFGSLSIHGNAVDLTVVNAAPNQLGYFLVADDSGQATPPGSQGIYCLGGAVGRFTDNVQNGGVSGYLTQPVDLADLPVLGSALPGQRLYFQAWFRDVNPGPTSNFSDGLAVQFL